MPHLHIAAELESDAAIGELRSSSFYADSSRHIPGSALRGALAQLWIAKNGLPDPSSESEFAKVFERSVAFGPLHKPGSHPRPLTIWTHKYEPGRECPRWADEWSDDFPQDHTCPSCRQPLQPGKGQIEGVEMVADAHVRIENGTAAPGNLFGRVRIARGQNFHGTISSGDPAVLARIHELVAGRPLVWFGGRRSTDGGRAALSVIDSASVPEIRVSNGHLDLVLQSPGIFIDDYGFPQDAPRQDELSAVLGVNAQVSPDHRRTRWTSVGGWHAASKLPKPVERAVAAGSAYRVLLDRRPDPERVEDLAVRGLGLRRSEGFGAVAGFPKPALSRQAALSMVAPLRSASAALVEKIVRAIQDRSTSLAAGRSPEPGLLEGMARSEKAPERIRKAAGSLLALGDKDLAIALDVFREGL